jgi:hypothetical protein
MDFVSGPLSSILWRPLLKSSEKLLALRHGDIREFAFALGFVYAACLRESQAETKFDVNVEQQLVAVGAQRDFKRLRSGHKTSIEAIRVEPRIPGFRRGECQNRSMPVFDEKQEELEHYETMLGVPRGRLAVTMDTITDAMALVGQHGVYCQSQRWPGKPVMDIQLIMKNLTDAKELIQSVMEELKNARQ